MSPSPDSPPPGVGARPVIRRYGRSALLIEADPDRLADWVAAIRSMPSADLITDLVPAANTVLVIAAPDDLPTIERSVAALDPQPATTTEFEVVELAVHYDGDDLGDVADASGLSVDEVIRRHVTSSYRVQFCGFAPGFAYLSGLDPVLQLPRRATPRPSVPAGSVAIAGPYAAVYPTPSPGGWHLLGHHDQQLHGPLFDAGRFDRDGEDPTLLVPGRPVRFRQAERPRLSVAGDRPEMSEAAGPVDAGPIDTGKRADSSERGAVATIRILDPGFTTTLQDGGRSGVARFAVSPSGAADPKAYELGQRIVGNRATGRAWPPSLEVVLGGLRFETDAATVIAITGAPVEVTIEHEGRRSTASTGHAIHLAPGSVVQLGQASIGLRTYVAVRGEPDSSGVLESRVLGSHSFDSLGRLGPRPLAAGDLLGFRQPSGSLDLPAPDAVPHHPIDASPIIELAPGPRLDWITDESAELLVRQTFTVSDQADRIGVRFDGDDPVQRKADLGELASEGLMIGAMQIPPDGRPIIFGPDHPTTGGYPVVAVAEPSSRSILAQLRPGQHVRFRWSRQ